MIHGVVSKGCYDMILCTSDMASFYKASFGIDI